MQTSWASVPGCPELALFTVLDGTRVSVGFGAAAASVGGAMTTPAVDRQGVHALEGKGADGVDGGEIILVGLERHAGRSEQDWASDRHRATE